MHRSGLGHQCLVRRSALLSDFISEDWVFRLLDKILNDMKLVEYQDGLYGASNQVMIRYVAVKSPGSVL